MESPLNSRTTRPPRPGATPSSAAAKQQFFLLIHAEDGEVFRRVTPERPFTVGRAAHSTIQLLDEHASRTHAQFFILDGRLAVEDLGSRNGTRLGARTLRSARAVLSPGDTVFIGETRIDAFAVCEGASPRDVAPDARGSVPQVRDTVVADSRMAALYETVERLAQVRTSTLILGETGAGKEVIAQRLHALSPRAHRPFVRLNCAAIPDSLLESELFGYEKGAFSGADHRKIGYIEAADQGTLFLDEIGELSPLVQAKLLAALENRAFFRVGGTTEIQVDVRLISATHRDLMAEIVRGRFREDLYYRISTFRLVVPALRERVAEISPLANLFVREFAAELGVPAPELTTEALRAIQTYPWPGNVRHLRNAMQYAVIASEGGVITREALPAELLSGQEPSGEFGLRAEVEAFERRLIERVLAEEGGNQTRAAARLGLPRRTLVFKLSAMRAGQKKQSA